MRRLRSRRMLPAIGLLVACTMVRAQAWEPLGPAPAQGGQVEGILNREVSGAVQAIAPHPTNADILYAGSVNGGIWRTTNATAASPTWTRLTDELATLSIGDIAFDPTDATRQTLVAGTARLSSLGRRGGALVGLLRTTNGGTAWTVLDGGGILANRNILSVVPRGATLVCAAENGVYRSVDTGAGFSLVSGAAGSGLPAGNVSELAADPGSNARLYVVVVGGDARGVYRSNDTGATWTKVSDAAVDAPLELGTTRVRITVGAAGQVLVAIARSGRLSDVFRSADGATGWTALGVPTTSEQNGIQFGAHPGGQASIHLSLAADPVDANLVYIGGDRQPYFGEGVSGSTSFFPNSLGAMDYSGRLFRGDAAAPAASRWTSLTHTDTPRTSPHADSRDLAFDAAGNLIESDDGGVYKRLAPRTTTGAWVSLNGDAQVTEYHGLSYDSVSNRVTGGAQDTGTTQQRDATRVFGSVSTGDGGHPAVQDRSSATLSTRYTSFQNLAQLRRRTVDAANVVQSTALPARTVTGGGPALTPQFYTPIVVNEAATAGDVATGQRLLIGAGNGLYESFDGASTIAFISPTAPGTPVLRVNAIAGAPLVYGVPGNPDFILAGVVEDPAAPTPVDALWRRTSLAGGLSRLATMPGRIADLAVDRLAPSRLFVLAGSTVQYSANDGAQFTNVTGNLGTFAPGSLRAIAFVPGRNALVVGTDRGVFVAFEPGFSSWSRLGTGLPNAAVYELDYDGPDDVLVAGLLGRGAWILRTPAPPRPDGLFSDGFED